MRINFKLLIIIFNFSLLIFNLFPKAVHAGFIVQRPLYIGLTNGLVGYWSFDGQDVAGNTAYDRSGQNNNGTLTNGPVRAIGKIGQALEFDGSNNFVDAGSNSLLAPDYITVSMWVNVKNADNVAFPVPLEKLPVNSNYLFVIDSDNKPLWRLDIAGNTTDQEAKDTSATVIIGSWEHWAGTYDGTTMRFYRNGVQKATKNITGTIAKIAGNLVYGGQLGGGNAFSGLIDDVRVYNRALNQDEIKRLYKIGATTKINVPRKDTLQNGLVGYWSFDGQDVAGNTAYDRSGQNNNGTLTNGPTRAIGRIGQALDFDGVNDLVNAGSATVLDNLGPTTISAWIFPRSEGETNRGFIAGKRGTGNDGWKFAIDDGATNALIFLVDHATTNLTRITSNNKINLSTWQYVVVTWDGSVTAANAHIYINGVESSYQTTTNGSGSRSNDGANSVILGENASDSSAFDGLIDDVRVYNRALSPDEIRRLYNMGR